jgi:hypothetical protein
LSDFDKQICTEQHIRQWLERVILLRSFLPAKKRYSAVQPLRPHPLLYQLKEKDLPKWVEFFNPVHGDILIITPDSVPIDFNFEMLWFIYKQYTNCLRKELCMN